jgi:3-hydroxybutyryl-CoA dehydrogenase
VNAAPVLIERETNMKEAIGMKDDIPIVETVGVVGAGVMGVGVAQNLAESGLNVVLLDLNDVLLDRAETDIRNGVRLRRMLHRSQSTSEDLSTVMARIRLTTEQSAFETVDFVIENVTEKPVIKEGVYAWLDRHCRPHCVFAANTSAISITRIGSWTGRPEQVIGTHFMNPVPMKSTVETIRGLRTCEQTIAATQALLARMGKRAILVNDSPGFVSNRVLMLTINEAVNLVEERVGTAQDVDDIFKTCFGHKMGPLETADLIGLDTILYSIEVLYESFADSKYRPSQLLKRMVDAGLYGRKSGQGFYSHRAS